jgi:O-antigen ligase
MDNLIGVGLILLIMIGITRTARAYIILWSFATPIFYIIFGAKAIFINLGFTDVELFSGVLPIVVTIMAFLKLTPTEKKRAWKYSPKLWLVFLGYYALSLLWSDNSGTGIRTVIQLAFPSFLYIIAFNVIQGDYDVAKYFKAMMIINIVVAGFDIYNAILGWAYIHGNGFMFGGVIGYRTVSAYFYATMGVLFFLRMMEKFSVLHLALFIVNVSLLLIMASRTPTYTFILGIAIAIIYRRKLIVTIGGIFSMAIFVGLLFILPSRSRFINEDNSLNRSDSGRSFFQQFFEAKANEAPAWGYGAGSSEKYAQWITTHITSVGAPHNEYLRVRFDGGQVGLILFYLGLADILIRGLFLGKWLNQYFPFKAILIMTPVMFALSCTNDNTFFYFYVFTQFLFTFMGFGARIAYEERVARGEEDLVLDPVELELVGGHSSQMAVT